MSNQDGGAQPGVSAHSREVGGPKRPLPLRIARRLKRRWKRALDRRFASAEIGFFVVGAGRGGTSLFASLLATHPRVAMGFEFECTDALMGEDLRLRDPARLLDERLAAFADRCGRQAGREAGMLWGNKITTEHLRALEDHNLQNPSDPRDGVAAFVDRFERARFLFVLRDGRACVRSKVQRTGIGVDDACERWRYSVAVLRQLEAEVGDRLLTVRFEDLVTAPEATMARACAFLGLEMEVDLAAGTRGKGMRADYRRDGVDASAAAAGAVPDGVEEALRADLVATGYLPR